STRASLFDANGELKLKGPQGILEMVVEREGLKISWNTEAKAFEVTFNYRRGSDQHVYTTTRLIGAISSGATLSDFATLAKEAFKNILIDARTHAHLHII
nr:hypothetical protein [Candidatus Sigynarchaeum springense]